MKIDREFPDYAFEGQEDACRILDNHVEEIAEALVGWHKTDQSQAFNLGDVDGHNGFPRNTDTAAWCSTSGRDVPPWSPSQRNITKPIRPNGPNTGGFSASLASRLARPRD